MPPIEMKTDVFPSVLQKSEALLLGVSPEDRQRLIDAIAAPTHSVWLDFEPIGTLTPELMQLANLKVRVDEDNSDVHPNQHNRTLENHMKLALEAAGNLETLRAHFGLVAEALDTKPTQELALQTFWIWAPLAEIAGEYDIKTKLEEQAFMAYYPAEREEIVTTYAGFGGSEALVTTMAKTRDGVEALLDEYTDGLPATVTTRTKGFYSVWRKCERDERTSYHLPDFFGVRVVLDDSELDEYQRRQKRDIAACYGARGVLQEYFSPHPDPKRFKDYILKPKANGYRSLHVTLINDDGDPFEVQIRTASMDRDINDSKQMDHMIYEAAYKITPGKRMERGRRLPRLYNWRVVAAQIIRERKAHGNTSLTGICAQQLIFYTDSNLYAFETEPTGLDLSFERHSSSALMTEAIERNGDRLGIDCMLRAGDIVKVHRAKVNNVNEGWRRIATTKKAKNKIEVALKKERQEQLIARGWQRVEEYFPSAERAQLRKLLTDDDKIYLADDRGLVSFDALLREIGAGTFYPTSIIQVLLEKLGKPKGNASRKTKSSR